MSSCILRLSVMLILSFVSSAYGNENASILSPWYTLPSIEKVKENIGKKIQRELISDGETDAKEMDVFRIGDSNLYYVVIGKNIFVTDSESNYWVRSADMSVSQLQSGFKSANITPSSQESLVNALSFLSNSYERLIVYPSLKNEKRTIIYALMDLKCPHSRDFHLRTRNKIQSEGYEIRYIPVISLDKDMYSRTQVNALWCANNQEERQLGVDNIYIEGKFNEKAECTVEQQAYVNFFLSIYDQYGLNGTPVFITESGSVYYGTESLLKFISIENKNH